MRVRPLTETSLIVHWLTAEQGRLATVAKGARRPRSQLRGKLDVFYLAEFSFVRRRRSDLHILREVQLRQAHAQLRHELVLLRQASYCAAWIERCTETESPLPEVYLLFGHLLAYLCSHPPQSLAVLAFEARLLRELGLLPDLASSGLTAGSRQVLRKLLELDWAGYGCLQLSAAQSRELGVFLEDSLARHAGKPPRGREGALLLGG